MDKSDKGLSHTVRTRDGKTRLLKRLKRALAIKALCAECLGWEIHPEECTSKLCPVWPFRGITQATYHGD